MKIASIVFCVALAFQAAANEKNTYERISDVGEVVEIRVHLPSPTEVSFHGSVKERIEFLVENYSLLLNIRDTQSIIFILDAVNKARGKNCRGIDEELAESVVQVEYESGVVDQYVITGNRMVSVRDGRCCPVPKVVKNIINFSF